MLRLFPQRPRRPAGSRGLVLFALLVLAGSWAYRYYAAQQEGPPPRQSTRGQEKRRPAPPSPGLGYGELQRDVVVRVADGDTITLRHAGKTRLLGVDSPEADQPGGGDATKFASAALLGKTIEYEVCAEQPFDRYGRGLAWVYVAGRDGRRVLFNSELVREGFARVYSGGACRVDETIWNSYYDEARRANRGLFATHGEVPDAAEFRRNKRNF